MNKDKYGVYDLTKFNYIDSHTKSVAICEKHGEFEITPTNLLSGGGCPKCKTDKLKGYFSSNMEDFTYKANKIHNNKYIYTSEYVNNHTPIEISCKCCGNTFLQTPNNHLQGKGCPFCNKSHLENNVINFFNENDICFEYQKRFEWLGKQSLDFFVPQHNIAIECQGKQHFEQTMFGNLNKIISLDEKISFTYKKPCHETNLNLIEELCSKFENLEYKQMCNFDSCCGFAGSFALKNMKLSENISLQIAENLKSQKTDYAVTTCEAYILGIMQGLEKSDDFKIKPISMIEFISVLTTNHSKNA